MLVSPVSNTPTQIHEPNPMFNSRLQQRPRIDREVIHCQVMLEGTSIEHALALPIHRAGTGASRFSHDGGPNAG